MKWFLEAEGIDERGLYGISYLYAVEKGDESKILAKFPDFTIPITEETAGELIEAIYGDRNECSMVGCQRLATQTSEHRMFGRVIVCKTHSRKKETDEVLYDMPSYISRGLEHTRTSEKNPPKIDLEALETDVERLEKILDIIYVRKL